MIAIDTSALMAMVLDEPLAEACRAVVTERPAFIISAVTLAEALVVSQRRDVADEMAEVLAAVGPRVLSASAETAHSVADAYSLWGKGVHSAQLNLMDCFAYVLAKANDCPLLYVGEDFAQTDVVSALAADQP